MSMNESLLPDQAKMILPRRMPDQRDIAGAHRIIGADKIRDRKRTLDPLQTPAAQRIIRWPHQPPSRRRIGRPDQPDAVQPRHRVLSLRAEPDPHHRAGRAKGGPAAISRSEEHTSEPQSLMRT